MKYNIILMFISLTLGIILSEIILRIIGPFYTYSEQRENVYRSPYEVDFEGHVYALYPNVTVNYDGSEFQYELATNSAGMRDKEHEKAKQKGEKRVIVIGDSFVEGVGAEFDATWVQQMQNTTTNDSLLFINGGVSGSDLFFGYQLLKERLLQYNPDHVLLTINTTDFEDYIVRGGLSRFVTNEKVVYNSPFKYESWYKHSHVVRLIVRNILGKDWNFQTKTQRKNRLSQAVNDFFDVIVEYQNLSVVNNFNFSVIFYPVSGDFSLKKKHNYYIKETNILIDKLAATNIHCIDLLDCVNENLSDNLEEYYWPIDKHYNRKGYQLLSECTLKFLFNNNAQ